jgi:dTDP-4-amino-4,6-dideoxygalactose transaminase
VLTVPFTFFRDGGQHRACITGATSVFVDIDPATFNMDIGPGDANA